MDHELASFLSFIFILFIHLFSVTSFHPPTPVSFHTLYQLSRAILLKSHCFHLRAKQMVCFPRECWLGYGRCPRKHGWDACLRGRRGGGASRRRGLLDLRVQGSCRTNAGIMGKHPWCVSLVDLHRRQTLVLSLSLCQLLFPDFSL